MSAASHQPHLMPTAEFWLVGVTRPNLVFFGLHTSSFLGSLCSYAFAACFHSLTKHWTVAFHNNGLTEQTNLYLHSFEIFIPSGNRKRYEKSPEGFRLNYAVQHAGKGIARQAKHDPTAIVIRWKICLSRPSRNSRCSSSVCRQPKAADGHD